MVSLSDYGEVWVGYSGSGSLNIDNEELECQFEAGQMHSGKVYVICTYLDTQIRDASSKPFIILNGNTECGTVSVRGYAILKGGRTEVSSNIQVVAVYELTYETNSDVVPNISLTMSQTDPCDVRFMLTNMQFDSKRNTPSSGVEFFNCQIGDYEVIFQQDFDYRKRLDQMQDKGVAITANMIIRSITRISDPLFEYVEQIGNLLSIALCNKINWLAYELLDGDGNIIRRAHHNRITMPYSSFQLIDSSRSENLIGFLETCYGPYDEFNKLVPYEQHDETRFLLMRFVTHMYLSAKGRGFIEMRALTLCSLVEVLTNAVCDNLKYTKLLSNSAFRSIKGDLREATKSILERELPGIDEATISQFQNTIQNRRSLEDRLVRFVEEYRIPIGNSLDHPQDENVNDEIGRFKKNRNKLTHQMKFHGDDSRDEYFFLLHFLDRIMLAILKYDNKPYINVAAGPHFVGSNKTIFNLKPPTEES